MRAKRRGSVCWLSREKIMSKREQFKSSDATSIRRSPWERPHELPLECEATAPEQPKLLIQITMRTNTTIASRTFSYFLARKREKKNTRNIASPWTTETIIKSKRIDGAGIIGWPVPAGWLECRRRPGSLSVCRSRSWLWRRNRMVVVQMQRKDAGTGG